VPGPPRTRGVKENGNDGKEKKKGNLLLKGLGRGSRSHEVDDRARGKKGKKNARRCPARVFLTTSGDWLEKKKVGRRFWLETEGKKDPSKLLDAPSFTLAVGTGKKKKGEPRRAPPGRKKGG